jgi:hypothetical protein
MRRIGVSKEGVKEVNAQAAQKRFRKGDMIEGMEVKRRGIWIKA